MRRSVIVNSLLGRALFLGGLLMLHVCFATAQAPSQADLAFEVASVKAIDSVTVPQMVIRTPPGGGIDAMRVTPRFLIRYAFAVDDSLIVGAPEWTWSSRFDVTAKGPPNVPTEATRAMLRTLLRERFMLRSHTENREMPVYALVTVGRASRVGRNLRRTTGCVERDTAAPRPSPPKALPPPSEPMPCGLRVAFGHISGGGITVGELVRALTQPTSRPVLDHTAMAGQFDLVMNFTPEVLRVTPTPDGPDASQLQPDDVPAPADPTAPSIFTALQEQLGLKLDATKGAIAVLVIDSIDRPTPN